MEEIAGLMKNEQIDEAVMLMEEYRLTPAILNEHLITLVTLGQKTTPLATVPPATKAKLTKLFNKRHEDARLKQQKGKNQSVHLVKFDPVLEEPELQDEEEEEV
jgi:hypothetical protein